MNLFDIKSGETHDIIKKENDYALKSNIELIFNLLKTLPLHFKLVLYAFIKVYNKDKRNTKVTVEDVFIEYQKLTTDLKIGWLSMNRVNEMIKELETYGFLKCKYVRKGSGQIRYIDIFQPNEIPRYISVLKEELHRTPSPLISQGTD
jgi:Cdc6-like AAA superfamily ATPase